MTLFDIIHKAKELGFAWLAVEFNGRAYGFANMPDCYNAAWTAPEWGDGFYIDTVADKIEDFTVLIKL